MYHSKIYLHLLYRNNDIGVRKYYSNRYKIADIFGKDQDHSKQFFIIELELIILNYMKLY